MISGDVSRNVRKTATSPCAQVGVGFQNILCEIRRGVDRPRDRERCEQKFCSCLKQRSVFKKLPEKILVLVAKNIRGKLHWQEEVPRKIRKILLSVN